MSLALSPQTTPEVDTEGRFVLVRAQHGLFALPIAAVRDMIKTPAVTPLALSEPYVRGVVTIRGDVLNLVDLRLRLGLSTAEEDTDALVQQLKQREQEHRAWIAELDASIREGREFKLTTNPHHCAFGRWFDSFKPTNQLVANHLARFAEPHRAIHHLATLSTQLVAKHQQEEALALVRRTRDTTLKEMILLFQSFYALLRDSQREITVVLEQEGHHFAVAVDEVVSVEELQPPERPHRMDLRMREIATDVRLRAGNRQVVLVLGADLLLP